jgi:hypothetical protein
MASNSSNMTAVGRGGTGTTSTPANNVDGNSGRRVSPFPSSISLLQCPLFSCEVLLTYYLSIWKFLITFLQSSQSGGLFTGLMSQKRNSTDATANARRESFADQKPAAGVIGNMWTKYVFLPAYFEVQQCWREYSRFTTGTQEKKWGGYGYLKERETCTLCFTLMIIDVAGVWRDRNCIMIYLRPDEMVDSFMDSYECKNFDYNIHFYIVLKYVQVQNNG